MQRLLFTLLLVVSLIAPGTPADSARAATLQATVTVTFDQKPNNPTSSNSAIFQISVNPPSANWQYKYQLKRNNISESERNCTDPSWTACGTEINRSGLLDGDYVITIFVLDGNGDQVATNSYAWTIDSTKPVVGFTSPAPSPDFVNTYPIFTFLATDTGGTGFNTGAIECKLDRFGTTTTLGTFAPCNTTSSYTPPANLTNATYTLTVRATDKAGNISTEIQRSWKLDTTKPIVAINQPTDAVVETSQDDVVITFGGSDTTSPPESGINRYECTIINTLNQRSTTNCSGSYTFDPDPRVGGSYGFEVVLIDNATNKSDPVTRTIIIDKSNPDTTLVRTGLPTVTNNNKVTFSFSGTDNRTTNLEFQCWIDADPWYNCTSPEQVTVNSDGQHTFKVRARDRAKNVDESPEVFTWTLDRQPPTLSITAPTTQTTYYTNTSDLTFKYNALDGGSSTNLVFTCTLNSFTEACDSSQKRYQNLAQGTNVFTIVVKDPANNQISRTITVTTDYIEPDTQVLGVQPNPTNNRNPTFTFIGSDNISAVGNLRYECSLNAQPWQPCTSGTTQFTNITDFTHTFLVRTIDQAGNFDTTPSSFTWRVDLGQPDTEIFGTVPVSMTKETTAGFQFKGQDTSGGTGVVAFECQLNTSAWAICPSPRLYSGLVSGKYTFRVRARDRAGNVDDTPAEHNWIIDIVPPSAPTISAPAGNAVNKLQFSFSAQDNTDGSGIKGYQCSFTTGSQPDAWVACASPYTPPGTFADGTYTFKVRAIDRLDNIGAPTVKTLTLDATAPVVQVSPVLTVTKSVNATFVFTVTTPGVVRAGETLTRTCRRDGTLVAPCDTPLTFSNLSDGEHTFRVDVADELGNTSATTATWRVDTQAPQATFDPQNSPLFRNDPTPTLTFGWNDGANGSGVAGFKCLLDGTLIWPCGQSLGGTNWAFTPTTVLTDGVHSLQIFPVDKAGNQGSGAGAPTYTWTLETQDPDTTLSRQPGELLMSASSITFTFGVTGTDTGPLPFTFECSLNGGTWTACVNPHVINNLQTGFYTFAVRAKDQAGNVDEMPPSTFWTVDRTGPTVSITSTPLKATNNPTATFVFTATDNLNGSGFASAQCRIDSGAWAPCSPDGVSFNNLAEGSHTFHVQAFDQLGNAGAAITYSWVVDLTAPETTFIGTLPDRITVQQITLQFTGTDTLTADGMKFECSLDGGPYQDCLSPRTFLGLTNGPHNLRVRARDGAGNVDASPAQHNWIVEVPNPQQSIFLPLVKK